MLISRKIAVLLCVTLLTGLLGLGHPPSVQAQNSMTACPSQSLINAFEVIILPSNCTLPDTMSIINTPMRHSITIRGNGHTLSAASGRRHFTIESGGWLKLENVVVAGGVSSRGGAIYVNQGGWLDITSNSVLRDNRTSGTYPSGFGGAIFNDGGIVLIKNSTLQNNSAHYGGGAIFVLTGGIVTVKDQSTLSSNTAGSGGAIYIGAIVVGDTGGPTDVAVINSFLFGNRATQSDGGAIINTSEDAGSKLFVINNTFYGNSAARVGAAVGISDASYSAAVPSVISNNTFSNGSASGGGSAISNEGGVVTVNNNIIANSSFNSCYGWFSSAASNLVSNRNNCGSGFTSVLAANLRLGPLQYNGGATQTMALPEGSTAIDTATAPCVDWNNVALTTDQRGKPRPVGARCDVGAYEYNPHQLNVTVNGSGLVTSDSPGIDCGVDCDGMFDGTVTLTSAPAVGHNTVWSGCTSASGSTCTVDMSSTNRTVTATFSPIMVTIDINKSGPGIVSSAPAGIDCGADCTHDYAYDSTVMLTAAPDTGHHIVWGGCNTAVDNTCTVDIAAINRTITALFTPNPYTLSVHFGGNGTGTVTSDIAGIDCGPVCASIYDYGTMVTLTAAPDAAYLFTGWTGSDAAGAGCGTASTCTITIDQARAVTAQFGLVAGPPVSCNALSIADGWGIYAEGTTDTNAFTMPDPPEGYAYAATPAYDGWCDVFTINSDHSPLPVTVCLSAADGVIGLYHDQPDLTRTWSILPTTRRGNDLCAELSALGSVALLTGGSSAQVPADASGDVVAPAQVSVNCQVTTTHILRFRDAPGTDSEVLTRIPYQRTLTASAMSGNWYLVNWLVEVGWVSADYVNAVCE